MTENAFERDTKEALNKLKLHEGVGRILNILTLGIFDNSINIKKQKERYEKCRKDYQQYALLLSQAAELDQQNQIIEIKGVRISKHTFADLPVVGGQDYGVAWDSIRDTVLIRDDYRCEEEDGYCYGPLQIHHLTPLSKGGSNDSKNLVTLCFYHHSQKHEHMRR